MSGLASPSSSFGKEEGATALAVAIAVVLLPAAGAAVVVVLFRSGRNHLMYLPSCQNRREDKHETSQEAQNYTYREIYGSYHVVDFTKLHEINNSEGPEIYIAKLYVKIM